MEKLFTGTYPLLFLLARNSDNSAFQESLLVVSKAERKELMMLMHFMFEEMKTFERDSQIFRQNTGITKLLVIFVCKNCKEFMKNVVFPIIKKVMARPDNFEINPNFASEGENLTENRKKVEKFVAEFVDQISSSRDQLPINVRKMFYILRRITKKCFPSQELVPIGAIFFLRYIVPAISLPENTNLVDKVNDPQRRALTIISKVIQNLVNNAEFGKKESFLEYLNPLMKEKGPILQGFLDKISVG